MPGCTWPASRVPPPELPTLPVPPDLAIFGGSFNPPGRHHRHIAQELARHFDQVIVVPCGPRPDKPTTNDLESIHRATMVDMTFRGLAKVRVDLFDLEASTFTRTHRLDELYRSEGTPWHVVGSDLLAGGRDGASFIHRVWENGPAVWHALRFAVVDRPGFEIAEADLPPHHRRIAVAELGASTDIRSRLFHREPVDGLLTADVEAYIERHGLYRGTPAIRQGAFRLAHGRFSLVVDERNPQARELADALAPHTNDSEPELIVVIGGDGTMLRAIRQHWRRRVPFYGLNAGHLGFLLNERSPLEGLQQELVLGHVPLLYVEALGADGQRQTAVAFNDTWVERATGQAAWLRVKVNGQERLPQLVADGALVATAAGSTAYARAMGAPPLPLTTPALLLVGSNVLRPDFWRPVVLPLDSSIELSTLDPDKRPLQAYIDGVPEGIVTTLRARVSNIAAVELVFSPGHDHAAKLAQIQFPEMRRI